MGNIEMMEKEECKITDKLFKYYFGIYVFGWLVDRRKKFSIPIIPGYIPQA